MDTHLFRQAQAAKEQVRIDITQEQGALEEQHGGSPDRGAATEPRQYKLAYQRLHLEEQECTCENRKS